MNTLAQPTPSPSQDGNLIQRPSGLCDCGRRSFKKIHGREWICERCERIEIAFNKRRKKTNNTEEQHEQHKAGIAAGAAEAD